MTDNEQRAHDLAVAAMQVALSTTGDKGLLEAYTRIKDHNSQNNPFSIYANFYREFLWRIEHETL